MRRCPLDVAAPRLTLAIPVARNLPRAWLDAIKRAPRIFEYSASFPELTGGDIAPGVHFRARRPERLRSIALVAAALIRRADRRTLRVGDQRPDGLCSGVTVEKLAEATGLCQRCVSRALAEGEGKYWTSSQPVEALPWGSRQGHAAAGKRPHRGYASVRVLTPLLFRRLGITDRKLARARRHGAKQWTERRAPPASLVAARALAASMRAELQAITDRARAELFEARAAARLERLRPKPKP